MTAPLVILVVDESDSARKAVARAARALAAETTVLEATGDDDALRLVRDHNVDLVLVDSELASVHREMPSGMRAAGVHAPIVLLTPTDAADSIARAHSLGAIDHIPKDDLVPSRLGHILNGARRVTAAEGAANAARQELERHAAQLERLAETSYQIHAAPTSDAALAAAIEAMRTVLGAEARVSTRGALTSLVAGTDQQVFDLAPPDASSFGTLALQRARAFDRAETLIGSQIARSLALVLERHRLLAAVHASVQARHEIVTIVSHDLRTPVQAFSLGLDALRTTLPSGTATPIFARLDRSIRSMRRLLSDLLDVATIQDGALNLRLATHAPSAIVQSVHAGCSEIARQKGLEITIGETAAGGLLCDGARVEHALTNLVSNAVKHTDRGHITLTVIDEGDAVCFEVADTGRGIDPAVQARLFERLYQGPRGAAGGIGLGLYIVRGIADAHGGVASVRSVVGAGSRFALRIPRSLSTAQEAR